MWKKSLPNLIAAVALFVAFLIGTMLGHSAGQSEGYAEGVSKGRLMEAESQHRKLVDSVSR